MAMRKTLARIFSSSSSSSLSQTLIQPPRSPSLLRRSHSDPGAVPTRLLQRRPMLHPAVSVPLPAGPFPALPVGDELIDRIRATTHRDRIRLDGLAPPPPPPPPPKEAAEEEAIEVAAARKAARAAEMEAARARLRRTERSCVAYDEFALICAEVAGADRGRGLARALDDSGAVIVLRDVVFLRPEMLAKAIESMIPSSAISPAHDPRRRKELKELKAQKATIDATAEAQVRRELWAGLGLLTFQTIGFMRLTFWELSWDVMEPICFFVTSLYFMAGYAFFLRTSRDPSFEGFFHRRFATKQKRLMRAHNFNLSRFDELSNAHRQPGSLPSPPALKHTCSAAAATSFYCDCHHTNNLLGTIH